MKKATIVVKRSSIDRPDLEQITVYCEPPFEHGEEMHAYVLVSRVNVNVNSILRGLPPSLLPKMGWETYIFASDERGNMENSELDGSVRDDIRPVELLKQLGWEVIDSIKP